MADFKFTEDQLQYLQKKLPKCEPGFIDWLRNLDCSKVVVTGIPDGSLVFANEPLLTLEGPFALL
jgi:nicotinate phosphoribosyltransferase